MQPYRISVSGLVRAPVERAHAIVADYRELHPRILPKPPFVSLDVLRGGVGAGTEIEVKMRMLGKVRTLHGDVTEPEPGRLIVESYRGENLVTSFRFEPTARGETTATISTDLEVHDGIRGAVERWFVKSSLHPVYHRELELLDALAREGSEQAP